MISFKNCLALSATLLACTSLANAAPIPPPQPDTIVNIPATAGNPGNDAPDNYCYNGVMNFVASDPARPCMVTFPITVPTGHSIKQISVIHYNNGLYPDPHISAYLMVNKFTGLPPYDNNSGFFWSSSTPVPLGNIETTRLMSQLGSTYYDTFAVDPDFLYNVYVQLYHGAIVHGLQITYN